MTRGILAALLTLACSPSPTVARDVGTAHGGSPTTVAEAGASGAAGSPTLVWRCYQAPNLSLTRASCWCDGYEFGLEPEPTGAEVESCPGELPCCYHDAAASCRCVHASAEDCPDENERVGWCPG